MRSSLRALLAALLLGLATGSAAADFTFRDTQGNTLRLADFRGKWVLVNFWATWCAPCLEELPELSALHDAHKDSKLVVIGVAMEYPSAGVVLDFLKSRPLPYPVVLGDPAAAKQIGPVNGLPTTYLFDPSGKMAGRQNGSITRKGVEEFIGSGKRL